MKASKYEINVYEYILIVKAKEKPKYKVVFCKKLWLSKIYVLNGNAEIHS
jgi:hypothetical protein